MSLKILRVLSLLIGAGLVVAACGGQKPGNVPPPAKPISLADTPTALPPATPMPAPATAISTATFTPEPATPLPTATAVPLPEPLPAAPSFTPCAEPDTSVGQGMPAGKYGPWASRQLLAYSDDGLHFTRANRILINQADVPNALVTPDGEIRVYFVLFCPAELFNRLGVAVSQDAEIWDYYLVNVRGLDTIQPQPVDPTVVLTPDGRYRLYFTSAPPGRESKPRSYSAVSDDGFTFEVEPGERFAVEGQHVLDPNLLLIGNTWYYFAGGVPQSNYHATSADGLTFTRQADIALNNFLFANGIALPNGYRYYGFVQTPGKKTALYSAFSVDGETWALDSAPLLEVDESTGLESEGVKDPAVARLPDGRYLLVYGTIIPGYPVHNK